MRSPVPVSLAAGNDQVELAGDPSRVLNQAYSTRVFVAEIDLIFSQ
jgi:hypothetical protein